MNELSIWNPMREMERMSNRFNRIFGRSLWPLSSGETFTTESQWAPDVDVIENDKEFIIKADLPDVEKKDVHVSVQDGSLCITGERKGEKEERGHRFHRLERSYGKFERSFYLPDAAKGVTPKAEFKNGTLTVHLPKAEEAQAKTLEVPVS
ncbi:MAG: Hsp20/alpha crystallin family protein [Chthoniobacterales bacterium]|nr:Hsp20/alpha crystallin family protein [Chthoniobacterales bacterium]